MNAEETKAAIRQIIEDEIRARYYRGLVPNIREGSPAVDISNKASDRIVTLLIKGEA